MAKPNVPVEDTCTEYLTDVNVDEARSVTSAAQPFQKQSTSLDEHTHQLQEMIRKLEKVGEITQEEIHALRTKTEALQEEIREVKESFVTAKTKQEEAEAAALDVEKKREEIKSEKTVLQNQVEQLIIAQKNDEQNRASVKKSYTKMIVDLRGVCTSQNSKLTMMEERLQEVEEENRQLKSKNNFLEETLFAVASKSDESNQLLCFSCKQPYSADSVIETECRFHPLPGLPPNSWHRWRPGPGEEFRKTKYKSHVYWPCCNTLSMRRPGGCCKGQHHQKWEMDVVMKRVMLSQETLEEMSRMEDTRII